jgi:hypothetical protein
MACNKLWLSCAPEYAHTTVENKERHTTDPHIAGLFLAEQQFARVQQGHELLDEPILGLGPPELRYVVTHGSVKSHPSKK